MFPPDASWQLDAARVKRGEERGAPEDQGECGEESQQPRRARAGPAGPPEEDPRENRVATGEASVQVTLLAMLPGQAGVVEGSWRWKDGGRRAARSGFLNLRRTKILVLTYRSRLIHMASLSGAAEPITGGEGGGEGNIYQTVSTAVKRAEHLYFAQTNSGIQRISAAIQLFHVIT